MDVARLSTLTYHAQKAEAGNVYEIFPQPDEIPHLHNPKTIIS
jgi:hypothetical protein